MRKFYFVLLLLAGCAASHRKPLPQKWVVTEAKGLSFQVQGRKGWYRLPQGDSAVHKGDTIYINYPGHEGDGKITKWGTK